MNAETTTPVSHASMHGSPGQAIREARTRAGLSLDELASRTRLARNTLEALEADAFGQLLEPVYVRGYYRKCARILNIDEQPLIDAYAALYTPAPTVPPARLRLASGGELGSVQRVPRRLAVLAPIAAIVLCAVIWLLRDWSPSAPSAGSLSTVSPVDSAVLGSSDVQPPIDPIIEPAPATPAPADAATAAATPPAAEGALPSDPAATVLPGAAPAATPETTPETVVTPTGTQLLLVFEAISWARVEDASGKSLLSGVIGAGEQKLVEGRPPYSVFLGNAPGVKVQFGGQSLDIKAYIKGNSTARFSVPVTGG